MVMDLLEHVKKTLGSWLRLFSINLLDYHMLQVVLEGMGRALHTNFNAHFKCDTLKVSFIFKFFVGLCTWTRPAVQIISCNSWADLIEVNRAIAVSFFKIVLPILWAWLAVAQNWLKFGPSAGFSLFVVFFQVNRQNSGPCPIKVRSEDKGSS